MWGGRLARLRSGVSPDRDQRRPGRPAPSERDARPTVFIAAAAIVATILPGQLLELQRGNFEPWRIVTCHLTHWSYEQLAWDVLAFSFLAAACARRNRQAFQATLLASVLLIPIAVLAFAPALTAYRGLSGLASAMFALLLTLEWRRGVERWPLHIVVLALAFITKLGFEAITGGTVFVGSMGEEVVAVPVAHLAGALIGGIGGLRKRRLALLAPLLLTSCVSLDLPLPIPRLDEGACNIAKDLLGNWRSRRITQIGPASVNLQLRDDCRFTMRIGLLAGSVDEEGTYSIDGDRLRLQRANRTETVWPIRRDAKGRLRVQEAPNEWHTYTHHPCASFWPCSSR